MQGVQVLRGHPLASGTRGGRLQRDQRVFCHRPTITLSGHGPQARTVGARKVPGLTRQIIFYPTGQW
jgi:hypothetical protein